MVVEGYLNIITIKALRNWIIQGRKRIGKKEVKTLCLVRKDEKVKSRK
jgi:hypothetical protein